MGWVAGVDVGGTFTDIVLVNTSTGAVRIRKVPTTLANQAVAFVAGLADAGAVAAIDHIVHGTTVGTNALLERRGAAAGLITSAGFRDILELGRRTRPHPYGMTGQFTPLIPRDVRLEVAERVDAQGNVVVALDADAVRLAGEALLASGCESVVVMFMHSYANPAHESDARDILQKFWPNDFISLSHEILPEAGEYERVTATAINALLQPLLKNYLARVENELEAAGFRKTLRVMQSNGGALNVATTVRQACRSVLSGPAGGAIAAAWIGRQVGAEFLVSADMGGTSFDVALIVDGQPALSERKDFAYGIPSRLPMIDIETIGAGGGSLIFMDEGGILQVGPQSAGSDPGPICYGRGGMRPTVTDANFLLNRIDIARILNATPPMAAVHSAFAALGEALGTTAEGAAEAALRVIDLNMAGAIRKISLEKGMDTRAFCLLPFGGAGPLHACSIAEHLFIPKVLVPPWPGVTSALGCVLAEVRHDATSTVHRRVDQVSKAELSALFARLRSQVLAVLAADGITPDDVVLQHEAALLYEGQARRFTVDLPTPDISPGELENLFRENYFARYGVAIDVGVRLISLRVRAAGPGRGDLVFASETTSRGGAEREGEMLFSGAWLPARIIHRAAIEPAQMIAGPARVDQDDTTTLIPPGWTARTDRFGNLEILHGPM
jgi:N-methylhydantoinase A